MVIKIYVVRPNLIFTFQSPSQTSTVRNGFIFRRISIIRLLLDLYPLYVSSNNKTSVFHGYTKFPILQNRCWVASFLSVRSQGYALHS